MSLALLLSVLLSLFAFSCSSTPLPKSGSVKIPEDFFGIVHAGRTKSIEEYGLLNEMGVEWILATFYWNDIERQKGVFDFSGYDNYVDTAGKNNKKIIAVLAYTTDWLFPEAKNKQYISSENLPLFLRFVEETVLHYKGRVDAFSIWNEPNFIFWDGADKDFFELSSRTAQKIRETDPDVYILGGAFWRAPGGFIKKMYKAGAMENIDALAFHPYAVNPSGSMKVYDKFLKTLSEINYHGPVWITEVGYPTRGWYPTRVSAEKQPSYVIKTITGAAIRGARVLSWYELFDTYNREDVPPFTLNSEKFFGLAYPDYSRKNGSWAYELCARFLPGSSYVPDFPRKENIPSNIVIFCFTGGKSGSNTLIIWNDKNRSQKVSLHLSAPALLHDISTGQNRNLPPETVLDAGKEPLFITWHGADVPLLFFVKNQRHNDYQY